MKQYLPLSFCIMIIALAGCGPIYKREYAYVPPASNMGKMCTAQCVQNQNSCQQMCQMRNENCRLQARQNAMMEYDTYRHERKRANKSVDRTVSDFDRSSFTCNDDCGCEETYRSCYSACGGQVLERDVCVAFCDKKK